MFSNQIVNVSSNNRENLVLSVVPNFMLVNKPTINKVGNKTNKIKKLFIWFDIRNEYDRNFDINKVNSQIKLENLVFQLADVRNGINKSLKPVNGKEKIELPSLNISRDIDGLVINENNTLVYELDADEFDGDLKFHYALQYKNDQNIKLTFMNGIGTNSGIIDIKANKDKYIFNNAIGYLENAKDKSFILNQVKLTINKRELNQLDSVNNPIAEVLVNNESKNVLEITKSGQLRGELERISQNGISYLETSEKGLKITNSGHSYKIYQSEGNHYDFQTKKWVKDLNSKAKYFDSDSLKLNFTFNNQNISLDWKLKKNDIKINYETINETSLTSYVTYKDIKQNTKFDTFIKARKTF